MKSSGKEDIYRFSVVGNKEGFRNSNFITTRPKKFWERRCVGNETYAVARFLNVQVLLTHEQKS